MRKSEVFGSSSGDRAEPSGELFGRTHRRRAGHVDVDVLVVAGVLKDCVSVGAPAGLHIRYVLGIGDVGDVEDANATDPLMTDRSRYALRAAVEPGAGILSGDEKEVLVHRDIALGGRTDVADYRDGVDRIRDIPHLNPVEVALDGVIPGEREVRVGSADERVGGRRGGQHAEVPDCFAGVEHAGRQADARVRGGRVDLQAGRENVPDIDDASLLRARVQTGDAHRSLRRAACDREEQHRERQEDRKASPYV